MSRPAFKRSYCHLGSMACKLLLVKQCVLNEVSSCGSCQSHDLVFSFVWVVFRDSKEFKDFWPFFYRYQSFKLRQHHGKTAGGSRDDRQSSRQPPMYNSERKADISASPSSSIASAAHHEEFISLSSTNVSSSSRNSVFESLPSTYNALDRINLTWSPATVAGATNSRYRNMRYFQQHYTTSGK